MAAATALIVALVVGKFFIPFMVKKKLGQSILEIGPKWHISKQGTPTMGGVLIIAGITASFMITGIVSDRLGYPVNIWLGVVILLFAISFGAIGFLDDYVKVSKKRNLGLTAPQKLFLQLAVSLAFISLLRWTGVLSPNLYIPFVNITIPLPWTWYMLLSVLFISGMVNAVNFTDGVDGLLGTVTLPIMVFFTVTAIIKNAADVAVISAASVGAIFGFLVYNFNPARIFMGDTGSLFLGGLVCGVAFALNVPIIILLVGAIYILEILSVILQVTYFKLTGGKRIFRMSPIHHHFEMGGWGEKKICLVFSAITILLCVVSLLAIRGIYIW
ncbi:MAG: phospho-N-acetylmuramoyl-pentapeptide-transferase [Clostridiales bacterium]|nr:phospho-N-acetylmuramoyl-pentapeptide-transferase [Clostridiales bacterium]